MGDVKRYDCTNGKARFCYGCYEMTEDADGNYVQAPDFDAALAREAALREELAKYKDGFFQRVTDEDLKRISDFVGDGDLPTNSFFMRADAGKLANMTMHMVREVQSLRIGLTVAEKRNAAIIGKSDKCKECGGDALFWFSPNTNTSGIAEGRLRTSEVTCTFVLGCADCSATIRTVRADTIAERMTAALKPTESGASE